MRTISSEALRYLIDHEHDARRSWTNLADERKLKQGIVNGELKMIPVSVGSEREQEAEDRYNRAKLYVELAVRSILGVEGILSEEKS